MTSLIRYSWHRVAAQTARVYDGLLTPGTARPKLCSRVHHLLYGAHLGPLAALVAIAVLLVQWVLLCWLRWWRPAELIERAPDFPTAACAAAPTMAPTKYEPLPVKEEYLRMLVTRRTFVRT
jgi:hypothetical protein